MVQVVAAKYSNRLVHRLRSPAMTKARAPDPEIGLNAESNSAYDPLSDVGPKPYRMSSQFFSVRSGQSDECQRSRVLLLILV